MNVKIGAHPLTFSLETVKGDPIQQLKIDQTTDVVSVATGDSPILGLGERGMQFDRRGARDPMWSRKEDIRFAGTVPASPTHIYIRKSPGVLLSSCIARMASRVSEAA